MINVLEHKSPVIRNLVALNKAMAEPKPLSEMDLDEALDGTDEYEAVREVISWPTTLDDWIAFLRTFDTPTDLASFLFDVFSGVDISSWSFSSSADLYSGKLEEPSNVK